MLYIARLECVTSPVAVYLGADLEGYPYNEYRPASCDDASC